jgi:antitoxin YefM
MGAERASTPERRGQYRWALSTAMVGPAISLRTQCGTLSPVAKTVPVREFRTNLSAFLSDVADRRDHVLVTRNGKPAAALVPIDEYDALEETAEILSDSETLVAIEAGLAEFSRDETVSLADLRAELAARRPAG